MTSRDGTADEPAIPPADSAACPPEDLLAEDLPVEALEAALGVIEPKPALPLPRWLGPLALCVIVGFLPWIVYLGFTLPRKAPADHYDVAWLGFDAAMWMVLAALAYSALRRRPATGVIAAVAATMLAVDAWFDVVTTHDKTQFLMALVSALVAEVPLAIICAWVAVNAERIRARAYRRLRLRWQRAIDVARSVRTERGVTEPPAPPAPR